MENIFSYQEFVKRNIGFVSEKEQQLLRKANILIIGVGGMGGAAIACLARAGVENFVFVDIDYFEISNLNRQVFSNLDVIGKDKAESTKEALLKINPELNLILLRENWLESLDEILPKISLVINGCDDINSTIQLMRKCKQHGKFAIDAFASTFPNVYVFHPNGKLPEENLKFKTTSLSPSNFSDEIIAECAQKEIEYVLTHSNSANYVEIEIAKEMINGKRKRISFAPMVITTGNMMAYEAIKIILNKKNIASVKGIFFNPYQHKIERPKSFITATIRRYFVKQFISKL